MPGVLSCVQLISVLELRADLVDIIWNLTRRLRSQVVNVFYIDMETFEV